MNIEARAAKIKLLILDVDGVLTRGDIILGNGEKEEYKAFNIKDGLGMRLLMKTGVQVAIITGKESHVVARRMKDLGVEHVYQNAPDKIPAFHALLTKLKLEYSEVAYVGDDLPDLPLIRLVGLGIAVNDAYEFIKPHAHYITHGGGGEGAVREVCDLIMRAQNTLESVQNSFFENGALLTHGK